LWNILRARSGHFASRQGRIPSFERPKGRQIRPNPVIVTETLLAKHGRRQRLEYFANYASQNSRFGFACSAPTHPASISAT